MSLPNLKLDRICRTCLMEENHMKSLFSLSEHYEDMDLVEMISTFSCLKVLENDKLPSQICSKCYDNAVKAYDFRNLCQKSGNILKNLLNKESEQGDVKPLSFTVKPYHSDDVNVKDELDCTSSNDLREEVNDSLMKRDSPESDSTLREHSSDCLENDDLICKFCGKCLKNVRTLRKHIKSLHEPHRCTVCDEINSNKAELLHENGTQEAINECEICHKRVELPCVLQRHLLTHTVVFTCDICKKPLKSQASLRFHKRTLHDIRIPHICEYCQQPMTTKQSLANHIRARHTKDCPFICKECGKSFPTSTRLQRHSWNHSKEENLRHICSFCSKPFGTLSEMKIHLRVHTDEKPFMCDICGKSFKNSSHLGYHRRGHLGEKNKECSYCGKRFNSSSVLKRHIRIHTGERPFLCQICGANFNQKNILVTHMKVHNKSENDKKEAAS